MPVSSPLTLPCQCEHDAHFDSGASPSVEHSHHEYMQHFINAEVKEVKTIYGTFDMCKQCAADLPEKFRVEDQPNAS